MLLSGYQCTKDCLTEGLYIRFQQNGASHTIYPAFNMSKWSGLRGLVLLLLLLLLLLLGSATRTAGRSDGVRTLLRTTGRATP